mgnify:CR=1 FL=1
MPDAYNNNLTPLSSVPEHPGVSPVSEIFTEPRGVGIPETTIAPNKALPENDETGFFVDTVARVPNLTPVEKHEPTTPVGEIPKEQSLEEMPGATKDTRDFDDTERRALEGFNKESVNSIT